MEDVWMYLAIVAFIITMVLYYITIDPFFKVTAMALGQEPPDAMSPSAIIRLVKEFFVVQLFFWLTLWAVKWSLLFMFKRLTNGLPIYNRIWWGVFIYSVIIFIGCCISNFTACSSMKAWFSLGECNTPRDTRAKLISLWFSLGADLSTDLLSKPIPPPSHFPFPSLPLPNTPAHRKSLHLSFQSCSYRFVFSGT